MSWYKKQKGKWSYIVTEEIRFHQDKFNLHKDFFIPMKIYSLQGVLLCSITNTEIIIYPGYSWNGADKFIDFENTMSGTCFHDLLIQMKRSYPSLIYTYKSIDKGFFNILRFEPNNFKLSKLYYLVVRGYDIIFDRKPYANPSLNIIHE